MNRACKFPDSIVLLTLTTIPALAPAAKAQAFESPTSIAVDNARSAQLSGSPPILSPGVNPLSYRLMRTHNFIGPLGADPNAAEPQFFWTKKLVAVGYSFSSKDSKQPDDATTETHGMLANAYFESKTGFLINPILSLSGSEMNNPAGARTTGHSISPSLVVGQELLRFFPEQQTDKPWTATLLGDIGYTDGRNSGETADPSTPTSIETDGYSTGVALAIAKDLSKQEITDDDGNKKEVALLAMTLTPGFRYNESETEDRVAGTDAHSVSRASTVEARLDYAGFKSVTLSGFATWNHDLSSTSQDRDWFDFRLQPAFTLGKIVARIGYTYTASNSLFDQHKIAGSLHYSF